MIKICYILFVLSALETCIWCVASTGAGASLNGDLVDLQSRAHNVGTAMTASHEGHLSVELQPAAGDSSAKRHHSLMTAEQEAIGAARQFMSPPPVRETTAPKPAHRHLLHSREGGHRISHVKQGKPGSAQHRRGDDGPSTEADRRTGINGPSATSAQLPAAQSTPNTNSQKADPESDLTLLAVFSASLFGVLLVCVASVLVYRRLREPETPGLDATKPPKSTRDMQALRLSSDSEYSTSSETSSSSGGVEMLVDPCPHGGHPASASRGAVSGHDSEVVTNRSEEMTMTHPQITTPHAVPLRTSMVEKMLSMPAALAMPSTSMLFGDGCMNRLASPRSLYDVTVSGAVERQQPMDFIPTSNAAIHVTNTSPVINTGAAVDNTKAQNEPAAFVGLEKMEWKFGDGVRMELPLTDAALLATWKQSNGRIHYKESTSMHESIIYVLPDDATTHITVVNSSYLRGICVESTTTRIDHSPKNLPKGATAVGVAPTGCTRFQVPVQESQLPGWILRGDYSTKYEVSQDGVLVATWEEDITIGPEWDPRVLEGTMGGACVADPEAAM